MSARLDSYHCKLAITRERQRFSKIHKSNRDIFTWRSCSYLSCGIEVNTVPDDRMNEWMTHKTTTVTLRPRLIIYMDARLKTREDIESVSFSLCASSILGKYLSVQIGNSFGMKSISWLPVAIISTAVAITALAPGPLPCNDSITESAAVRANVKLRNAVKKFTFLVSLKFLCSIFLVRIAMKTVMNWKRMKYIPKKKR